MSSEPSAAQQLLEKHAQDTHHVTVEDAPDEDLPLTSHPGNETSPSWGQTMSTKAAGKQKAQESNGGLTLDTSSTEAFPALGGDGPKAAAGAGTKPIWLAKETKTNGSTPTNGLSRSSTPASENAPPRVPASHTAPSVSIPGRNVETLILEPSHVLSPRELKKPLPNIINEINRRARANVTMANAPAGKLRFEAAGPEEFARQALKDLVEQIGTKLSVKVQIPKSARAHIIGRQGVTIKALQEKTGARINLPKVDDSSHGGVSDDEDETIDVEVVGNAFSARAAQDAILEIAGERAASSSTKLKGVPPELYPFIAGPGNSYLHDIEQSQPKKVQIRVPAYQAWSSLPLLTPPAQGARPTFSPARADNPIQLEGDRAAIQAARAEIERRVEALREELTLKQGSVDGTRHRFIIGERGIPMDDFFAQTGCSIMLPASGPTSEDDPDLFTVIGPADKIEGAMQKAMDLANGPDVDVFNLPRNAAAAHNTNVTRYLRQRREIQRLEDLFDACIVPHFDDEGRAQSWQLYGKRSKSSQMREDLKGIFSAHPPSRMVQVPVHPFFHQHLRTEMQPRVRQEYGVHLVIPDASEAGLPVLFVYEGEPQGPSTPYRVPQTQPTADQIRAFQQGLQAAQRDILKFIQEQGDIESASIEVPQKFHEKLRRFIKREQENRPVNQVPVRVSNKGTTVTLRGPAGPVQNLLSEIEKFVEQEKADEKERDFTLTFDFPQKVAHHLIGKDGKKIRELREEFDVDIQVQDGKVELKGPKAKAEVAKARISALGRQWADETTHTLKIDPKFHGELIGSQGSTITRLQNRYKVNITFPRAARAARDDQPLTDAASDAGKPRRTQEADEVVVRGSKKGADEAREELLSLLQYLRDNSHTDTIFLQQKQLPSLIGQGGSGVEALRQSTGAKIDVPKDSQDDIVEVQIKGTKAQVDAAKKILQEKKAVFDDTVVKTIEVDKKYHKALIGTGGANIKDIVVRAGGSDDRRDLARAVQFPRQESDGNVIKIEGRTDVVDKIISNINEIVAERESQVTEVVDVPIEKHRSLIGRGGDTKRQMEAQFHVSIDIPRQGNGQTGVKVVGLPADVEKAKNHILSVIQEQQGETFQVPRSLHHAISNGGQFFRRLRNDLHVTVDHGGHAVPPKPTPPPNARANGGSLPLITDDNDAAVDAHSWNVVENASTEEGEIPWILRGSSENVEKAKKTIQDAIDQAKKHNATGFLILPDPRTYRHVIGQGGSKVNSIRKQSGCKINVPRDQAKDEAIEIMGSKDGVEQAKDLILAAVRDGVNGRARE